MQKCQHTETRQVKNQSDLFISPTQRKLFLTFGIYSPRFFICNHTHIKAKTERDSNIHGILYPVGDEYLLITKKLHCDWPNPLF